LEIYNHLDYTGIKLNIRRPTRQMDSIITRWPMSSVGLVTMRLRFS